MQFFNVVFILNCFFAFFCSIFITFLVVFFKKYHIHYTKDTVLGLQKFHTDITPRIGGIPFYISFFIGVLLWIILPNRLKFSSISDISFLKILLLVTFIIFLLGLLEDITKQITPASRLIIIFVINTLVFLSLGIQYERIDIFFIENLIFKYQFPALLLTVLFISSIMNGFNMIDGFHGLMLGYAIMIFIVLGAMSIYYNGHYSLHSKIIFIIIPSIIGLFVFNFPSGKIFSGDATAYLLGFLSSIMSIYLLQSNDELSGIFPFAIFSYAFWEVIFSIVRKTIMPNRSPFQPDGLHFHMLVYKRIAKKRFSNPNTQNFFTSIIVWIFNFFFIILSGIFAKSSIMLTIILIAFIFTYLYFYKRMFLFQIHFLQKKK